MACGLVVSVSRGGDDRRNAPGVSTTGPQTGPPRETTRERQIATRGPRLDLCRLSAALRDEQNGFKRQPGAKPQPDRGAGRCAAAAKFVQNK